MNLSVRGKGGFWSTTLGSLLFPETQVIQAALWVIDVLKQEIIKYLNILINRIGYRQWMPACIAFIRAELHSLHLHYLHHSSVNVTNATSIRNLIPPIQGLWL